MSDYIDDVRSLLLCEPSLPAANRDAVLGALERIADRLRTAEASKRVAAAQLAQLRTNYQVRLRYSKLLLAKKRINLDTKHNI